MKRSWTGAVIVLSIYGQLVNIPSRMAEKSEVLNHSHEYYPIRPEIPITMAMVIITHTHTHTHINIIP
jgi:hypothetical protein